MIVAPKLSVIVPIYNMEKYLPDFFQSILDANPPREVEFVFVNDGSTDLTNILLANFISDNELNIKIINQVNQGVSAARNTGVLNANGEYIAFIDPDDMVVSNYFEKILEILNYNDVDIIQFGAKRFFQDVADGFIMTNSMFNDGVHALTEENLMKIFSNGFWVCWLRVFRKKLFENIKFPRIYSAEDLAVIPIIFLRASSIYYTSEPLYLYRFNPNSFTTSKDEGYLHRAENSYKYIFDDFKSKYAQYPLLSTTIVPIIRGHIYFLIKNKNNAYARKKWKYFKRELNSSEFDPRLIRKLSNKLFYRFGVDFLIIFEFIKGLIKK
ncbi:glycosyltransferase [Acinetobacter indicus]|uniref:glycosyltransferase n=1 Tax=Acinetobacter indicus TaxID=756892 RepID=UPI0014447317